MSEDLIREVEAVYLRNELTAEGRDLLSRVSTALRRYAARVRELGGLRQAETDLRQLYEQRAERAEAELADYSAIKAEARHWEQERQVLRLAVERAEAELARARERIAASEGVAAHDKLRAERDALRTLLRERCPECKGTGMRDSGGTHPWGEPVLLPCDHSIDAALGGKP